MRNAKKSEIKVINSAFNMCDNFECKGDEKLQHILEFRKNYYKSFSKEELNYDQKTAHNIALADATEESLSMHSKL